MLKKTITAAVLGVSVLSMIAANAAAPGVYITGQLGYANKHNLGDALYNDLSSQGDASLAKEFGIGKKDVSKDGLAGRLAVGYQFNQNFALEVGYMQTGYLKTDKQIGTKQAKEQLKIKVDQNAIDIVGKGIWPVGSDFNVYVIGGVAYLTSNVKSTYNVTQNGAQTIGVEALGNYDKSSNKWVPEVGAGVGYNLTQNITLDASWRHLHAASKKVGNVDFASLGINYYFG